MKEAAENYGATRGVSVLVTAGPTPQLSEQKDIDAWLIWNIWQVSKPALVDQVRIEEPYRIYRDTGIVPNAQREEVSLSSGIH